MFCYTDLVAAAARTDLESAQERFAEVSSSSDPEEERRIQYTILINSAIQARNMSAAERLLSEMRAAQLRPGPQVYAGFTRACAEDRNMTGVFVWFRLARRDGLDLSGEIFPAAMRGAANTGNTWLAKGLLRHAKANRVVVGMPAYCEAIKAAAARDDAEAALEFFRKVQLSTAGAEREKSEELYSAFLSVLRMAKDEKAAKEWLHTAEKLNLRIDMRSMDILIDKVAKANDLKGAVALFRRATSQTLPPSSKSFSAIINGCANRGDVRAAVAWFQHMENLGLPASAFHFTQLLKACIACQPMQPAYAEQLFRHMVEIRKLPATDKTLATLERAVGEARFTSLCEDLGLGQQVQKMREAIL
eukprot:TRINITY_DN29570_c0_g1_i1.p1 TRINITY_DN29570_c0_g1~~TRINITY_DN29570_c0_g1_i1.p1  ORF type:complete len:361 (-),score=80.42 TRINITY_DN29570_c0_g1_i1:519-1601(-)